MRERDNRPFVPAAERGYGCGDAKVAPMSDERLAEIEASFEIMCGDWNSTSCYHHDAALELLAEVRRLKRALQLSEASRGVPSVEAQEHCMACLSAASSGLVDYPWTCAKGHVVRYSGLPLHWRDLQSRLVGAD